MRGKSKKKDPLLNEIFFDKYKTVKKLGEGSFGKVYKAEYNGEYFALKFESHSRPKSLLEMEGTIMTHLQGPNIPFIKSYGYSGDYNLLVMQLMDRSLEDIFRIRKTFSIKTTAMIGFQLIGVLHFIHDKNIIHRDVKPDNCVMGSEELNENLYLIDFGLAKKYRSSRTLKQYPLTRKKRLTGTARYASIHALEGYEQSRRDDMESVGYIMAYFLRGGLPWQGMKLKSKENKYKNILEKKKEISSEELFKGFPNEFAEILEYTKNLDYLQEPEYQMLRNKLMDLCKRLNYSFDYIYDWTTERDLAKRKNKIPLTSLKTQSTLSVKSIKKRSKSKKKEKYVEKSADDLKNKKNKEKKEKNKKDKNKEKGEKKDKTDGKKEKDEKKESKKDKKNDQEKNKEESKENDEHNDNKKDGKNNEKNTENNSDKNTDKNNDNTINEDEHENDEEKSNKNMSNNTNKNKHENDDEKKSDEKDNNEKQKEDDKENRSQDNMDEEGNNNKSNKTDSFENEENKEESRQNKSNGAEFSEEEVEPQDESVCCKM